MTKAEAREALDELGLEYPMSGKGSGITALKKLLDAARAASPVVDAVAAIVEAVEELIVTPYEKMQRDHGFQFSKTHNGYAWSVELPDGTTHTKRWRAFHDGRTVLRRRRGAMQDARDLLKKQ